MNNSLEQYIQLYRDNGTIIDAGSAPALNALRGAALAALEGKELPHRLEGYERTSLRDMFAPDFGVNVSRVGIPVNVAASFKCDVPNLSTLSAFIVNDAFRAPQGLDERLPEGVLFMGLAEAATLYPELVAKHYGHTAPMDNVAVALNTLLAQDGAFIYIPAGVKLEKPLQLVEIFSAMFPLAAFRRVLVVVEKGASAKLLICDHTQELANAYLASAVTEVVLAEDAHLEVCHIEESTPLTSRCSQFYMTQAEGSTATVNSTVLTCGSSRSDFRVDLCGEHAECRLSGMAIEGGEMHVDANTFVRHLAPRCKSEQLFKYVLDGNSTGAFEGRILVTHEAPFTEAYQSNRNIIASEGARMHCKPQLEIYNDDVKCSHGATTGQLDADALFYMRSRGIPEHEARTLLMQAFMVDVIDTVQIPGLQERLRHLVDRRFAGKLGSCTGCQASEGGCKE